MAWDNDENRRIFETCYAQNEKRLNPLAYWLDSFIWEYSHDVGLAQSTLYQEGFDRLGCIGCPMARRKGRMMEFARWSGFQKLWIHTLDRMVSIRAARGLQNNFATGQEWFDWWMTDEAQEKPDENQTRIDDF